MLPWRRRAIDRRMVRASTVLTFEADDVDGGWIVHSVGGVAAQGETLAEAARQALDAFVAVENAHAQTTGR
jgi:predicted RNase H-like HicB family nuclease